MIIRIQSPDGQHRITIDQSKSNTDLYNEATKTVKCDKPWTLYHDRQKKTPFARGGARLQLKHGEILFLFFNSGPNVTTVESASEPMEETDSSNNDGFVKTKEDQIDVDLWKVDWSSVNANHEKGTVIRVDEMRADPWDAAYLKEHAIKFLSFHSHMRKLTSGVDKGKFVRLETEKTSKKLENEQTRNLSDMPSSITLNRQPYRHVDNVCFANREIMERFLEEWRNTGNQQVGWLMGKYTTYDEVPLGVKCEVEAIYRPAQKFQTNVLTLGEMGEADEAEFLRIASELGLARVGWIVTDLVPDKDGKVKETRSAETHFVTAEEAIIAGRLQARHPNPCRLAPSGYFGSKFVTVVVTGKDNGEIDFRGYQISNQGQALAVDGTIVPTIDAPEFGYTRETTDELYCPDVFYRVKDEYGNSVTKIGRPLPIEYLLTDMGVNFAIDFTYTVSNKLHAYKPARSVDTSPLESIGVYLRHFPDDQTLIAGLRDFNLLLALNHNSLPCKGQAHLLRAAVRDNDIAKFTQFLGSNEWLTTRTILEASGGGAGGAGPSNAMDVDDELRMAIERSLRET